ncbi:NTP transferase domain-containing protein [Acidisphaera sp. L21]|uniref:NTP transferase domain-containing protein n=1 Tax=Acidisphaera sp. L21 TaxID=1641851 RepID=UPI00131E3DC0|nr:molybdopterin-binding/glycosyltransferase family 2 protein [Acidisphaera sp. L21]
MIFGPTALDDAEGAVLVHTHRVPGRVLKKGLVLDAAAIAGLRAAGLDPVVAARLEAGDVGEDAAARRIATALLGPGLTATRAATGRVNLTATTAGLLLADRDRIDAVNAVDEAVTVATLPNSTPVTAGEMVATIKIIPFAVPGCTMNAALEACAGGAMRVLPWQPRRVGLVLTTLPGLKPSVIEGTVAATETRVLGVGGILLPPLQCPHRTEPIAAALRSLLEDGADLLLIAGASAVVDRRDVGPAGIVAAGGEILHFGMPVDPGNLICLGRIGDIPALVLPGCARSPKPNGIDLVLHRLATGLPVTGNTIARMGVGGLLKDVTARPLPRARATAGATPHGVAAVILAAGQSSRMAPRHKLLVADSTGRAMVARVVDGVLASRARPVLVVTGHREDEVRAALAGRPVQFVTAPDFAAGLSASLRAGLAAMPATAAAALVVLGDMPLVTAATIDRLVDTYDPDEGRTIVVPSHDGEFGNPVLWDRRYFPAMMALTGDKGARSLLRQHGEAVAEVAVDDTVLRDFDTADSLLDLPG